MNKGSLSLPNNDNMYFYAGSTFENAGSVTQGDNSDFAAEDASAVAMTNDSGASISYTGSTNSSIAYVQTPFTNIGSITVGKGTYQINAPNLPSTADTGSYALSSGAVLQLYNTRTLASASSITGQRTLRIGGTVTAATVTILPAGAITVQGSLTISSGSATLSNVTVSGTLTLSIGVAVTIDSLTVNSGSLIGPGSLTIPAQGTATFNPGYLHGIAISNQGTVTVPTNGYLYLYAGASFDNAGSSDTR